MLPETEVAFIVAAWADKAKPKTKAITNNIEVLFLCLTLSSS
tara:strand:- start:319 stop:444 length:126 start_codon:yes stop_codon:yes gene_type:complete